MGFLTSWSKQANNGLFYLKNKRGSEEDRRGKERISFSLCEGVLWEDESRKKYAEKRFHMVNCSGATAKIPGY